MRPRISAAFLLIHTTLSCVPVAESVFSSDLTSDSGLSWAAGYVDYVRNGFEPDIEFSVYGEPCTNRPSRGAVSSGRVTGLAANTDAVVYYYAVGSSGTRTPLHGFGSRLSVKARGAAELPDRLFNWPVAKCPRNRSYKVEITVIQRDATSGEQAAASVVVDVFGR